MTHLRLATSDRALTGIVLLVVGALFLLAQFISLGWLVLPLLSLLFLALGIYGREVGWLIPAGILGGLGAGILLENSALSAVLPGDDPSGGFFMFAFALGWASIVLTSTLFTDETHWWPLIPGGIMALVGTSALGWSFAEVLLSALTWLWPLALIALGLYLLLSRRASA